VRKERCCEEKRQRDMVYIYQIEVVCAQWSVRREVHAHVPVLQMGVVTYSNNRCFRPGELPYRDENLRAPLPFYSPFPFPPGS
jgi:hypothetical protein